MKKCHIKSFLGDANKSLNIFIEIDALNSFMELFELTNTIVATETLP